MSTTSELFSSDFEDGPPVRGSLYRPATAARAGLVFAHGAGGNSASPLLLAIGEALSKAGLAVLLCDLPYRQKRPKGPPSPSSAKTDREGLRRAVAALNEVVGGPTFIGGQSYGGRQATMVAAEDPEMAAGLLLTSYPLHPPGRPDRLRTEHLSKIQTPGLFAHGDRDSFGSLEEMRAALRLIPVPTRLLEVPGGGHGLGRKGAKGYSEVAELIRSAFEEFFEVRC